MLNFLFTVVLLSFSCVTGQHQRLIQGDPGLKRSRLQHGVSYANFEAHAFQHLQGSLLDSSSELVRDGDCAFAWFIMRPVFRSTLPSSQMESGLHKFRSRDRLIVSEQLHHYSIEVSDN